MVMKNNNAREEDPDLGTRCYFFKVVNRINNLIDLFFDEGKVCDWVPIREELDKSYGALKRAWRPGLQQCYNAAVGGIDAVVEMTKDRLINEGRDENDAPDVVCTSTYILRFIGD